MQRIVSLFDTHVPFQIPLDPVMEFIQDFRPTIVVLGGDLHDWTAVSHWIADQSRYLDGGVIAENYAQLKSVLLTPVMAAAPDAKVVYLKGNHEEWIDMALRIQPNGRGYWELERNVPEEIQIIQVNMPYAVNSNLVYIHGLYTNEYHAKKTVNAYHTSVIYGHVHTVQSYMMVSPVDSTKFYKGQSVGCLCHLNPMFMKNKPSAWINGFSYAYVDDDDSFQDEPVIIVKNKFWANGRRYQ